MYIHLTPRFFNYQNMYDIRIKQFQITILEVDTSEKKIFCFDQDKIKMNKPYPNKWYLSILESSRLTDYESMGTAKYPEFKDAFTLSI